MDKVYGEIVDLLAANVSGIRSEELTPNTRLREDLFIDSLKMVEVILWLEEHFGVTFDESEINPEQLLTVQSLVEVMKKAS